MELEASGDYEEVFDLVMELQDDRHDEQDKVADFSRLITVAEEKIHGKESDLEMLEAKGNDEYFDEVQEDDENNHSNGNVVKRGITRLYKFRMEYEKPDGIKLSVTFDALIRISRKHRTLFLSILGDMVREHIGLKILSWKKRYFDVKLTVRKLVKSAAAKTVCSKSVYQHTIGRGGYTLVKEKMDSSNAITPDLPTEEPNNSLSMRDEHLSTILKMELNELIKSNVEDLVPIPSESEGIFDDTCDVPFCDNSAPLDVLNYHFEIFFDFNDDCTSSDDDSFEDINYIEASPSDYEFVSLEEVKDDILREKLLNINLLIAKIESLNDNPTPDCVLKSPSLFPIPVKDSDSFFEKSDHSLSYSDNSLPEFKNFINHTEETSSGSTNTHADNSLPKYDSFLFEIEPNQDELISVVMEDILGEPHVHVPNVLPTHATLMLDSDFIPSNDSLGSDLEDTFSISFIRNLLCPMIETLLPFSSKNKEKVFNPVSPSLFLLQHAIFTPLSVRGKTLIAPTLMSLNVLLETHKERVCSAMSEPRWVNKDGEYPDDEIRSVGDKLKETKDKIKEGTLKVDHGTDAMTVVLGMEKGGYARGVGSGVTYKRYFDLPRSRQASDDRILLLQKGMVTKLKNQLAVQGGQLQSMSTQLTPTNVIKCKLWHLKKSTIIALGTVYKTDERQMLHNKELPKDYYKLLIDTSLVDATCILDVGNNGFKTAKDTVGGFLHGQRVKIQRHGQLVKKVIQVSDAEVAKDIAIGEIGPRVSTVEGQGQQTMTQRDEAIAGLSQQCILGMDRRLTDLEKRSPGP
nr:hypothetical protein [Tanacetum cinerariifolium]